MEFLETRLGVLERLQLEEVDRLNGHIEDAQNDHDEVWGAFDEIQETAQLLEHRMNNQEQKMHIWSAAALTSYLFSWLVMGYLLMGCYNGRLAMKAMHSSSPRPTTAVEEFISKQMEFEAGEGFCCVTVMKRNGTRGIFFETDQEFLDTDRQAELTRELENETSSSRPWTEESRTQTCREHIDQKFIVEAQIDSFKLLYDSIIYSYTKCDVTSFNECLCPGCSSSRYATLTDPVTERTKMRRQNSSKKNLRIKYNLVTMLSNCAQSEIQ